MKDITSIFKPYLNPKEVYKGGKNMPQSTGKIYKLSSNENPIGASPKAVEALLKASTNIAVYPDQTDIRLREALALDFDGQLTPEQFITGNSGSEVIDMILRAFVSEGDEVIFSNPCFLPYAVFSRWYGAKQIDVPLKEPNYDLDVAGILRAITEKTRVIFLTSPNNPTGSYVDESEIRRLIEGLPPHVICVLDAAYAEYVSRNDYEAGAALVDSYDNVVMLRTFSKIHGLAALRLGWAYGPAHIVDAMNRIRGPFNTTAPALAAGVAAIEDTNHVETARQHNDEWLPWLSEELKALGLEVPPSVGNFLIAGFKSPDQTKRASKFLETKGIIARDIGGYELPHYMRLTVGLPHECKAVVAGLKEFLSLE